jgi:hypothetical protein
MNVPETALAWMMWFYNEFVIHVILDQGKGNSHKTDLNILMTSLMHHTDFLSTLCHKADNSSSRVSFAGCLCMRNCEEGILSA